MQTTEALTTVPGAEKVGRLRGFIREIKDGGAFGFIHTDDNQVYFFHHSECRFRKRGRAGMFVEFTVGKNTAAGKRDRALNIEVVG